ncbi:hypothetical protein FRB95_013268 [Tulasnella sp. JGI-2019a]|nr:hypothetical protein FRB95_013268 [Tulasnella sp. JGI-2019a]
MQRKIRGAASTNFDVFEVGRSCPLRLLRSALFRQLRLPDQHYSYRNSIAPKIHTIPSEIFTRILLASTEEVETWSLEHLHTLTYVCKYWSSVVLSTPQLWTVVKYDDSSSDHLWKLAVERSRQLPISCQINVGESFWPLDPLVLRPVSEESHRWRSMDYKGVMTPETIQFLQSPCPKLEYFALQAKDHSQVNLSISFGEHLRSVRLDDVGLRWDECALHNLRNFRLRMTEGWGMKERPSLRQILAILSHSPTLEVLELTAVSGVYDSGRTALPEVVQQIANVEQIGLLSLRTLKIVDLPSEISFSVFTKVHAPYVDDFFWRLPDRLPATEWLSFHRAESSQSVLRHLLAKITSGDVVVVLRLRITGVWRFEMKAIGEDNEGVDQRLKIELQTSTSNLENIFDLFMVGSVTMTLSLKINSYGYPDPFPLSIFDSLPAIRQLEMNSVINTEEILSHLSRRSGQSRRWPCPMMTHLMISTLSDLPSEALASFKSARYPDQIILNTMEGDCRESDFPAPLVSLVVLD